MANPIVKSPFSDAQGKDAVPHKGNVGGVYDREPNLVSGMPDHSNSPNGLPELHRDTACVSNGNKLKEPQTSGGPLTRVPFKDAVS